jgi:ferric-dicitrate binding protein FerR (iron transport regulator)
VKSCPNCGWSNNETNRYCENCGADLRHLTGDDAPVPPADQPRDPWSRSSPEGPQGWPAPASEEVPPSAPEWRMAPLPHEEPPSAGRRIWLWVVVALLVGCLAVCAVSLFWLQYTDSGQSFQTRVAEEATRQANSP